jgi:hypothetical protein
MRKDGLSNTDTNHEQLLGSLTFVFLLHFL